MRKKLFSIFILSLFLASCGEEQSTTKRIKIDIDALDKAANQSRMRGTATSATAAAGLPPQSISDFGCFFVNIKSTGSKNYDPNTFPQVSSSCMGLEAISNVVDKDSLKNRGVSLTIPRSPAASHIIQVYGMEGAATTCSSILMQTTAPKIFLVAEGGVGTLTSDIVVSLNPIYNKDTSQDKNQYCQTAQLAEISPTAAFTWVSTTANATTQPQPELALVNLPELDTTNRISPTATTDLYSTSFATAGVYVIDFLFDITNIDPNLVKGLQVKGSSSQGVYATLYRKLGAYPSYCSSSANAAGAFICNASFAAGGLSLYGFNQSITVAAGSTSTIARSFLQVSFRASAAAGSYITVMAPKLVLTF